MFSQNTKQANVTMDKSWVVIFSIQKLNVNRLTAQNFTTHLHPFTKFRVIQYRIQNKKSSTLRQFLQNCFGLDEGQQDLCPRCWILSCFSHHARLIASLLLLWTLSFMSQQKLFDLGEKLREPFRDQQAISIMVIIKWSLFSRYDPPRMVKSRSSDSRICVQKRYEHYLLEKKWKEKMPQVTTCRFHRNWIRGWFIIIKCQCKFKLKIRRTMKINQERKVHFVLMVRDQKPQKWWQIEYF